MRIGGIELRRVRKDVVTAPFVPNAGKNPPPGIAQSMDAQGMGYQRPFSPGTPLAPWLSYGGEPRAWDYQTGFNISTRPRNGLVSFDTIGQICYSYDWARICRKRRIDSFRSFDWSIVPADGQSGDLTSAIEAGRAAISKPDGITPYKQWIAKYLWDLFTYDAGSLYKRRDVTGRVYALDVVDGTSIAPLVDYDGRPPTPPAPAFVQFVMGLPFDWQTASDLIYEPFWPVPNSPYGQAPIEDVLLTANTDMRMTMGLLDDWTDGNIPGGWGEAPAEMTDPAAIQELEDRLNGKLQQDQKVKVQVHLVPAGFKFTPNRKQSFDEPAYLWLARKTCAAFGVVPEDVGITQDVNRATADTQMDVQERVSDRPLAEHIDGILTAYLQDDLGLPVKMQTTYAAEKEDRVSEAQVWKIGIEAGAASVDDMRQEMFGLTVDTERPVPRFIMTAHAGPVPLADLFAIAGPIDPETAAPAESIPLVDTHAKPLEPVSGLLPGKTINTPGAVVTTFNPDEPQFPQAESLTVPPPTTIAAVAKAETSGVTSQTGMTGHDLGTGEDEDDEDVRKELSRWRDNARGRVKLGKAPRQFASTILPVPLWTAVWKALEGATTRTQVDAAFAEAAKSANPFSRANPTAAVAYPVRKAKHPTDALLDQIVGHYAPLVGQALASALPSQSRLAQGNLTPADLDLSQLQAVLTEATTDAWVGGALIAAATVPAKVTKAGPTKLSANQQGSLPPSMADTDWGAWTPGWAGAAATISDPGLDAVLSGLGFTLKGIASSTIDQIGSQIAQGVASGASMDSIAMGLRDYVGGDASRAFTIADTECARAAQSASMQTYQANGIEMLDWLVADDPCDDCQANADGGPYAVDAFPDLPAHPRCRCASSPNVDSILGTSTTDDTTDNTDDADAE